WLPAGRERHWCRVPDGRGGRRHRRRRGSGHARDAQSTAGGAGAVTRLVTAVAVAAALVTTRADAHHSYVAYVEDQTVSIEGTIESVRFANPHVLVTIRTDASEVYTIEWQNLVQL